MSLTLTNLESSVYLLLSIHCFMGLIAAIIALNKGRSLGLWLFLGLTCGIAALIVALLMKPKEPV
ncbi:MAG: hypothetical protein ACRDEA_06080 [Microcystaceae cyanobacterium]